MIRCDFVNLNEPLGRSVKEIFMDNGDSTILTCHGILDEIAMHEPSYITVIFDKTFLREIIHSHVNNVRKIVEE